MADGVTSVHGRKFGLAYLALAAVLGAAVGTFVLLVRKPAPAPPPAWSAWRPEGETANAQAKQIASHVARRYHLADGKQLVRVYVGSPNATAQPIRAVAVASTANADNANFQVFDATKTTMYILCGTGKKCAIKTGKATVARAAVLRREALELALYTFEYVDGVDSVVAFFPPKSGENPAFALFFRRGDLEDQLDRPLRHTLPQPLPPVPGKLTRTEKKTIDELTTERVFRYAVQNARDGQRVLVLAPVA